MKNIVKFIAGITLVLGMTACTTVETASRASPLSTPVASLPVPQAELFVAPDFSVSEINVTVPHTLTVSEANTMKPIADIVWREEALGNRHTQVRAIVEEGLQSGVAPLAGAQGVILDVQLVEFHAQTPKVRYTFGGQHEVQFLLTVRNAQTGAIITPQRLIDATFKAYGGEAAIVADRAGITQKSRIIERLSAVIEAELKKPYAL
jgi:hypothetical protein